MRIIKTAQYCKTASVTFQPAGGHRIAQPRDIFHLSNELGKFVQQRGIKLERPWDQVAPDGDAIRGDGFTGNINFYIDPKKDDQQKTVNAINEWISEMRLMDYEIQFNPTTSPSGVYHQWQKFQINVIKNASESLPPIPSLNIHNLGAETIMKILGLPEEYAGYLDPKELLQKLESVSVETIKLHSQQPSKEELGQGGMIFNGGANMSYLVDRLASLRKMAEFCIKNGFDEIEFS